MEGRASMSDDLEEQKRKAVRSLFGEPAPVIIPEDDTDDAALKAFVKRLFAVSEND